MRQALAVAPFRRLAFAYAVNALGSYVGQVALALLVFESTRSVLAVALLMVAGQLLPALAGPLLVARLERVAIRSLLPGLHGAEALVFGALAALGSQPSIAILLALAFADGLLGVVARPLVRSTVVAVTRPRGVLREANAVLGTAFSAAVAAGPAVGGVLWAAGGARVPLMLDAASFAIAAVILRRGLPDVGLDVERAPLAERLRAGVDHIRGHVVLRRLIAADLALSIAFAVILPVEVVYVTGTLGASSSAFGLVLAAWGAGAVIGSVLLARLGRLRVEQTLLFALIVVAVAYLGMGAAGSVAVVAAFSLLGGLGNGIEACIGPTLIQERTCEPFQARVNAVVESIHTGAPGLGFAIGGLLAATASARATYLVAGCSALAVIAVAAIALRDADWEAGTDRPQAGAEAHTTMTGPPAQQPAVAIG